MTNQVFRDQNGWYHFVVAQDTTQSTASDRVKIYVNGSQVTSFSIETYPSQNLDGKFNTGSLLEAIGTEGTNQRLHLDGYMTEINYIDGQQLDSSYFGFTDSQTGIWKPKRYEGTYGTNGYHLEFKDNSNNTASTLGKDTSGNGNDWTPVNFSVSAGKDDDSMIDTPTNNFPTFNLSNRSSGPTLSQANLRMYYNYKPASKTTRTTFRFP